jgi:hypothetical protein
MMISEGHWPCAECGLGYLKQCADSIAASTSPMHSITWHDRLQNAHKASSFGKSSSNKMPQKELGEQTGTGMIELSIAMLRLHLK